VNRPADNAITLEQDAATATRAFSVTCPHDCPDACSMCVTVNSGSQRALKIEGDPRHPVTRGYLCNKVNHYLEYINSPRRMHYPHRRVGPKGPGAKFEGVAWDTALAEIAGRLKAVIAQYGAEAVQPCSYSGTLGVLGFSGMGDRFFNRMGAARLARTICTAAGTVAKFATFGPVSHADIQRIPEMDVVIPWATNIVSTGVHMVPFINEAKARGATFGHVRIVEGMLAGVVGAPKQLNGSTTPGGLNANALTSQQVADLGGGPVFYSTLAEIEKTGAAKERA